MVKVGIYKCVNRREKPHIH